MLLMLRDSVLLRPSQDSIIAKSWLFVAYPLALKSLMNPAAEVMLVVVAAPVVSARARLVKVCWVVLFHVSAVVLTAVPAGLEVIAVCVALSSWKAILMSAERVARLRRKVERVIRFMIVWK